MEKYAYVPVIRFFLFSVAIVSSVVSFIVGAGVAGGNCPECYLQEYRPLKDIEEVRKVEVQDTKATTTYKMSEQRRMVVTGYTSSPLETDEEPCISADGSNICQLFTVGDNTCGSNDFPLQTIIEVKGLGICTVRDRMNKRFSNRVDWYFGFDRQDAYNHGIRTMLITVQ